MVARPGADPAFESLLRSTQALAKNIRQAHEQQQGPISPQSFPHVGHPPPPLVQPTSLRQLQMFQQQQSFQQPHDPSAYLQGTGERSASVDAALRSVSIDSDMAMAFDGIEEVWRRQFELIFFPWE